MPHRPFPHLLHLCCEEEKEVMLRFSQSVSLAKTASSCSSGCSSRRSSAEEARDERELYAASVWRITLLARISPAGGRCCSSCSSRRSSVQEARDEREHNLAVSEREAELLLRPSLV